MNITVKFWIFILHLLGLVSGFRTLVCPAGSYEYTKITSWGPPITTSSECLLCEEGFYSATAGQTACTPCCDESVQASDCHAYSTLGATSCQLKSTLIRADCTKDQSMTLYEHLHGTGCKCYGSMIMLTGTFISGGTTCTGCLMGYGCTECVQGRYWAPACTACPAGAYSNTAQATVCTLCATGKYKAATDAAACTDCAAGKYSATSAATAEAACTACAGGATSLAGASAVGACFANLGYTGPISGAFAACTAGKYKAQTGPAACTDCAAGKWSAASAATTETTCTACAGGSSSPQGSTAINACVANNGFFGNPGGPFTACGLGTYSSGTGATACVSCGNFAVTLSTGSTSASTCLCQVGYTNSTTSGRRLLTYESTHVPQGLSPPALLTPTLSRQRQAPQSPQSLRIEYGFSRPRRLFGRRSLEIGTCSPCQPYYKNASGNGVCTSCPDSMYSPDGLSCIFKSFNTTSSVKTTSLSIQSSVASTSTAFQNTITTIVMTTPAPVVVPTSTSLYIITARTTPAPVSETQTDNVLLVIGIVSGCCVLLCLCLICFLCFCFESNDREEEYQRKLLDG